MKMEVNKFEMVGVEVVDAVVDVVDTVVDVADVDDTVVDVDDTVVGDVETVVGAVAQWVISSVFFSHSSKMNQFGS